LKADDVLRIGEAVVEAAGGTDPSVRKLASGVFGGHVHARAFEHWLPLAQTSVSVVLQGATGTGKERFAQLLHEASGCAAPPVAGTCAITRPRWQALSCSACSLPVGGLVRSD